MDREKTLTWLAEVSNHAATEAAAGNPALVNKMANQNSAFAFYFNNVHKLGVMNGEQFANQYPHYMREADLGRLDYEALEAVQDQDQRLTKIEEGLEELRTLILESQKPAKRKRKAQPVQEADEEVEADTEEVDDDTTDETEDDEEAS